MKIYWKRFGKDVLITVTTPIWLPVVILLISILSPIVWFMENYTDANEKPRKP